MWARSPWSDRLLAQDPAYRPTHQGKRLKHQIPGREPAIGKMRAINSSEASMLPIVTS